MRPVGLDDVQAQVTGTRRAGEVVGGQLEDDMAGLEIADQVFLVATDPGAARPLQRLFDARAAARGAGDGGWTDLKREYRRRLRRARFRLEGLTQCSFFS